uniref:Uncharacterized protein n=1 Tax=Helicotheca tamesis TaxID=374047 RepID=A0A7S2GQN7_9STRA|mmetsp:Transcript_10526/g.14763  ORF Transcript_10526/g.14763 Transcript_10526/m.14763 type:complete len:237 (+) Transcript_10526:101-811(+)|eukprot:CAMPEP_0185731456 /NCGR_PEP_ID=MMETSP1171-20130828/12963_1 /TAXON_ID=374046 /ORGANISM="Helicotheca tamensis, Strain CCMP826" /LENGTH=236 /DNA_ID=CAMNT_0028400727 /DNA_START=57 /DNA_END=767 /DNA_ORIENTATION=+
MFMKLIAALPLFVLVLLLAPSVGAIENKSHLRDLKKRELARGGNGGGGGGGEKITCVDGQLTKACGASGRDSVCDICPGECDQFFNCRIGGTSCTDWCRDVNNLGDYHESSPEAYVASDNYNFIPYTCSSSTGCTCTLSSYYASTYTIVTNNSDRICDAHNLYHDCGGCNGGCAGGCDGSQCDQMIVTITGRVENDGNTCICEAEATNSQVGKIDVYSSDCSDNDGATRAIDNWIL